MVAYVGVHTKIQVLIPGTSFLLSRRVLLFVRIYQAVAFHWSTVHAVVSVDQLWRVLLTFFCIVTSAWMSIGAAFLASHDVVIIIDF